jgi:serine/threonine protein kinase
MFSKLKELFGTRKGSLPRIDVKKRFELLGKTGQGSMSKVFRARDNKLGRIVCLKVLDKVKTARFEQRFVGLKRPMEGAICMGLRHQNVVQTYEYGLTTSNEQYLIMELIDGMGLNFLIETKSPGLEGNRINFLVQSAEALEYIHQQGFLHRDICPRNIMINKEGVLKFIDFGLAVPFRPEFCKPGNRTGTKEYMAPELIKRMTTDQRVDLFALGVTAYETFTGTLPWERAQTMETVMSHLNTPGQDPRKFNPDMDDALAKFLIKSVEREPKKRFQTAKDFREALKALPKQDY